jgi:hypothetical protein
VLALTHVSLPLQKTQTKDVSVRTGC